MKSYKFDKEQIGLIYAALQNYYYEHEISSQESENDDPEMYELSIGLMKDCDDLIKYIKECRAQG